MVSASLSVSSGNFRFCSFCELAESLQSIKTDSSSTGVPGLVVSFVGVSKRETCESSWIAGGDDGDSWDGDENDVAGTGDGDGGLAGVSWIDVGVETLSVLETG